jgi:hypothetical protein
MAGLLGALLEPDETADLEQAWVDNVKAQWRATGAYRERPLPRETPTGPVLPVSREEWFATAQLIFLAFNDVAAALGLEAKTPTDAESDGREGLLAALEFAPYPAS